jgi:Uma2 family endonuclease
MPPPDPSYPESDGEPLAENTLQWDWIVKVHGGLQCIFRDRPDVFVAADLLWYPVRGEPTTRTAPDAMVAFGRPQGHRRCYKQWEEGGVAPQVVFEIQAPGNRAGRIVHKFKFYERFGVSEFYAYDPHTYDFTVWLREGNELKDIGNISRWVSPLLDVRFDLSEGGLRLFGPGEFEFLTFAELGRKVMGLDAQTRRLNDQRGDSHAQASSASERVRRLEDQFRRLGLEPPE